MKLKMLEEAHKIWSQIRMDGSVINLNFELDLQRKLLSFLHVGNFYYYIFDVMTGSFNYISPQIVQVLGYSPEEITTEFFFSRIHPDDQPVFLNYEKEVVRFFQKLPVEKICKYKFSYDYRVQNSNNTYIRILQQVITIEYDSDAKVLVTLGVHTDISHIKKDNSSSLSFIGLDNEPSYFDVKVNDVYKTAKSILTSREKQIVHLIIGGYNTAFIAQKLSISPHTVKTHRTNITIKTKTKSVAELAYLVIKEGWL
jgi:DNA-binding CsgD family transcriptional regulator